MNKLHHFIEYVSERIFNYITGICFWLCAYFAEIGGAIHVMAAAFLLDLIIGIINAICKNNEKFQMKKVFIQFERFVIVLLIIMLLYAMDREMKNNIASVYNGVMWLISGFLTYSVAENAFNLTGWKLFSIIKEFIKKKTKENTDLDLE